MIRLVICNVFLEGRCRLVLAALRLDWDDFSAILQNKIDLTVLVWKQVEMKFPHLENFIAAAREIPAAKDSMPRYEPALCLMGA